MKIRRPYFFFLLIFTPPLFAGEGFELRLVTQPDDDMTVNWWLSCPNGEPLEKIGERHQNNLRFYIPFSLVDEDYGQSVQHPGDDLLRLTVHAKAPIPGCSNGIARYLNIFQHHCQFHITINLNDNGQPTYMVDLSTDEPLIEQLSYEAFDNPFDLKNTFVQIKLKSFENTKQLIDKATETQRIRR